ncbi:MAG: transcriptional regulator [Egibacteraceae bacterium]
MPELDPVIHAQGRLRALVTLATLLPGDRLTFPRMQELLDMTAGNLLTHLRKLEEADYVDVRKRSRGRSSVTSIAITPHGRSALEGYRIGLRQLLDDVPQADEAPSSTAS